MERIRSLLDALDLDESIARSGETLRQAQWRDELLRTGIRGKGGTVSLPFEAGKHRRVAVKIVDDRGIESLKIIDVE